MFVHKKSLNYIWKKIVVFNFRGSLADSLASFASFFKLTLLVLCSFFALKILSWERNFQPKLLHLAAARESLRWTGDASFKEIQRGHLSLPKYKVALFLRAKYILRFSLHILNLLFLSFSITYIKPWWFYQRKTYYYYYFPLNLF